MASQNELEKYTRNFVFKSLQVIVQSRMGEKCKYTAKENTNEWFTIPIPDIPELTAVARKTLGSAPALDQAVNVEISLKRKENNAYIFLEIWSLSLDKEARSPEVKVSSQMYGRMSLVLRSIMAASRVTPAYRLAKGQQKDDYQIHYQYTLGPPDLSRLSDNMQTRRIGMIATPVGAIHVALHYTTKPLHLPHTPRPGPPLHPKNDHFSNEPQARYGLHHGISEPKPCNRKFRNPTSVEDLRNLDIGGEKQDTFNFTFSTSPPEGYSISPPPTCLPQIDEASSSFLGSELENNENIGNGRNNEMSNQSKKQKRKEKKIKVKKEQKDDSKDDSVEVYQVSAFADSSKPPVPMEKDEDMPFYNLISGLPPIASSDEDESDDSQDHDDDDDDDHDDDGGGMKKKEDVVDGSSKTTESKQSSNDDDEEEEKEDSPNSSSFEMLPPLDTPWRDRNPSGELPQFFQDMHVAQGAFLYMCEPVQVSPHDLMAEFKTQIDYFASKQPQFEKFIDSLGKEDKDELSD